MRSFRARLSINPEIPDDGKEENYERHPGRVSFVFDLSFSELLRVQKNLRSLSKTLFRQADFLIIAISLVKQLSSREEFSIIDLYLNKLDGEEIREADKILGYFARYRCPTMQKGV
jgi:hypothetical protein